jgi:hypothetical protein
MSEQRELLAVAEEQLRRIIGPYAEHGEAPPLRNLGFDPRPCRLELRLADGQRCLIYLPIAARYLRHEQIHELEHDSRQLYWRIREECRRGGQVEPMPSQSERWRAEARADPEIGGDRHNQAMQRIGNLIDRNTVSEAERRDLLALFETAGIGNNPTLLRFLHRVAVQTEAPDAIVRTALPAATFRRYWSEVDMARAERSASPLVTFQAGELTPNLTATEIGERGREVDLLVRDAEDRLTVGLFEEQMRLMTLYPEPWFELPTASPAAEQRGMALLRSWLTPAQLAQYDADKFFEVIGCASKKRYRIRHGRATNVDELDGAAAVVCRWCFVPAGNLVIGDVMLAQKIALETDELGALHVGVRSEPVSGRQNRHAGQMLPGHVSYHRNVPIREVDRIGPDGAGWV